MKRHTQRKQLYGITKTSKLITLTLTLTLTPNLSILGFDKGVHTVKDLVDQNLDFLTYEEFQLRYQLQTNFLTYYDI